MTLDLLLTLKAGIVLGTLLVFGAWERLRPVSDSPLLVRVGRATRRGWQRLGRNLGLFGLNLLLSPLLVVPLTAWAESFAVGLRPDWWSGWTGMTLDILVLDLWLYGWHRANHEIQALWRFHQVHHLDETLDTTSALRFHFGEVALSAAVRALVIVLLDVPLASVILFEALVLAAAVFHHSDAALPPALERRLSALIVTPSIHWVHHHAIRSDTDSNYATLLSVWDRLFGSASGTRRWAMMPIGVESLADRPFLALLAAPFGRTSAPGTGDSGSKVPDGHGPNAGPRPEETAPRS